jgi:hypothetical protein
MPNCFHCATKIPPGKGVRKEVYVARSRPGIFSKRFFSGRRSYYSQRWVCDACAKPTLNDWLYTGLKVIGVILLGLLILGLIKRN